MLNNNLLRNFLLLCASGSNICLAPGDFVLSADRSDKTSAFTSITKDNSSLCVNNPESQYSLNLAFTLTPKSKKIYALDSSHENNDSVILEICNDYSQRIITWSNSINNYVYSYYNQVNATHKQLITDVYSNNNMLLNYKNSLESKRINHDWNIVCGQLKSFTPCVNHHCEATVMAEFHAFLDLLGALNCSKDSNLILRGRDTDDLIEIDTYSLKHKSIKIAIEMFNNLINKCNQTYDILLTKSRFLDNINNSLLNILNRQNVLFAHYKNEKNKNLKTFPQDSISDSTSLANVSRS